MKRILVVGAGFSGSVIARELAERGFLVNVIDKRSHIAGNAYDYVNEHGIRVHMYGPHLFHTSNMKIVEWLSRFTEWVEYKHKVKALLDDGRLVTLPVNKETMQIIGKDNILNVLFRPYTKKMWDLDIEEIDPSILQRIPTRNDDNEYYFPNDFFQALPKEGYTKIIENILNHPLIDLSLNTAYSKDMNDHYFHIFNSMPIDSYFDYELGELPYRSIKFHTYSIPIPGIYPVATVNFTHTEPFTRVTEWCNLPLHSGVKGFTTLTVEEPCDYKENNMERYYPVKDINGTNNKLYKKYKSKSPENMTFIGRCGMYVYMDMHQAISIALNISRKFSIKYI